MADFASVIRLMAEDGSLRRITRTAHLDKLRSVRPHFIRYARTERLRASLRRAGVVEPRRGQIVPYTPRPWWRRLLGL